MSETWKDIPGYGGWYQVSDAGRVRSWRPWRNTEVPRILCQPKNAHGYLYVSLFSGGRQRSLSVSRLVMLSHVGQQPPGMEVCHTNGISTDNRLTNLRWGTKAENAHDKVRHGTLPQGERAGRSKLTDADVLEMRHLWHSENPPTGPELGRRYGVTKSTVWHAVTGRSWAHLPMPEVS